MIRVAITAHASDSHQNAKSVFTNEQQKLAQLEQRANTHTHAHNTISIWVTLLHISNILFKYFDFICHVRSCHGVVFIHYDASYSQMPCSYIFCFVQSKNFLLRIEHIVHQLLLHTNKSHQLRSSLRAQKVQGTKRTKLIIRNSTK